MTAAATVGTGTSSALHASISTKSRPCARRSDTPVDVTDARTFAKACAPTDVPKNGVFFWSLRKQPVDGLFERCTNSNSNPFSLVLDGVGRMCLTTSRKGRAIAPPSCAEAGEWGPWSNDVKLSSHEQIEAPDAWHGLRGTSSNRRMILQDRRRAPVAQGRREAAFNAVATVAFEHALT
jgi:hypothetical protein